MHTMEGREEVLQMTTQTQSYPNTPTHLNKDCILHHGPKIYLNQPEECNYRNLMISFQSFSSQKNLIPNILNYFLLRFESDILHQILTLVKCSY